MGLNSDLERGQAGVDLHGDDKERGQAAVLDALPVLGVDLT